MRRRLVIGSLATWLRARSGFAAPAENALVLRVQKTGYYGITPGPSLRAKRGEEFAVRVVNELDEPIAIHWHGVRLTNTMDGVPPLTQAAIAPGASFDYRFVARDAGTFWYHPPAPNTPGLTLIVETTEPVDVDHDVTLIYAESSQERRLKMNGLDAYAISASTNQRVRLRLINATAAQILKLRLEQLRTFIMAIDGQPAQPFVAREGELTLGPGNRIDAFVDCTLAASNAASLTIEGADGQRGIVAQIRCDPNARGRSSRRDDPEALPANPLPERMDFHDSLRFDTAIGHTKNDAPLFAVKRGRTITLGLSNPGAENGFIHLHGHSFRLLDALDDGWKPFWLDTMPVAPGGKARIAFVADDPGKWLIEGWVAPTPGSK
ncbi:MAG: multicopper oxidase family protein [Xanthobacteraceae bacterium]